MKILICGVGAIGSNLAANLVADLKPEHEITILDYDIVEERNIQAGTQFYLPTQVGLKKVEALQYLLYEWYGKEVKIIDEKFEGWYNNFPYDLVIDCFDNYDARLNIQADWHNFSPKVFSLLHLGFSKDFTFAIEWAENYQVPSDITSGFDICTMQGAGSFVKMVASIGSLTVQDFLNHTIKREFIGNKLTISKIQ